MPDVQAAVSDRQTWIEPRPMRHNHPERECDFRQLRHQTKHMLQQILAELAQAQYLRPAVSNQWLMGDLRRRILLTAELSDALFGLTRCPAPMSERLRQLGESLIRMLADDMQMIQLDVTVTGDCPEPLQQLVLRVAHEFVGNAIRHGMRARVTGTISVRLSTDLEDRTELVVTDDGWGFDGSPSAGEGMKIAGDLANSGGGTVGLHRNQVTVATLELPSPAGNARLW